MFEGLEFLIDRDSEVFYGSFTGNYVYKVVVDGTTRYIGMSKGSRYMHAVSGKSSCKFLNKDFFSGKVIKVLCIKDNLTVSQARKLEAQYIKGCEYLASVDGYPFYNVQGRA